MKGEWDGLPTDIFSSQKCFGVSLNDNNQTKLDLEHRYLLLGTAFLMVKIIIKNQSNKLIYFRPIIILAQIRK